MPNWGKATDQSLAYIKANRVKRIRRALAVTFLIVALACAFAWAYLDNRQQTVEAFQLQEMYDARQAASSFEARIDHLRKQLAHLAAEEDIIKMNGRGQATLRQYFSLSNTWSRSISRVSTEMKVLYTTPFEFLAGTDVSGQAHIQRMAREQRPHVSCPFITAQHQPAIAVSVPVFDGGSYDGCLVILLDYTEFAGDLALQTNKLGAAFTWVFDGEGVVIYSPMPQQAGRNAAEIFAGNSSMISLLARMREERAGEAVVDGITAYGEFAPADRLIAAYTTAHFNDQDYWTICVAASERDLLAAAPVAGLPYLLAVLILACLLIAGIDWWRIMGKHSISLEQDAAVRAEELKESEERLRTVIADAPVILFSVDTDGVFTLAEGRGLKGLGLEPGELVGQSVFEVYADVPRIGRNIRSALAGESFSSVVELGGLVFESWYRPIRDAEGRVSGVIGVATDVTQRHRAEKIQSVLFNVLQASSSASTLEELLETIRQQLSRVIDTTNFYVALYDEGTGLYSFPYFVDVKDKALEPQPLKGSLTDYVRRTGKPLLANAKVQQRLERKGAAKAVGTRSPIWLGAPLKAAGSVTGVVVVQSYTEEMLYTEQDLQLLSFVSEHVALAIEHKRAGEALREGEENYRRLVELAQEGITTVDQNERITFANPAFINALGFDRDEVIGRPITDLCDEESVTAVLNATGYRRKGITSTYEIKLLAKDGEYKDFMLTATPLFDTQGNFEGALAVCMDITGRKQTEQALRESEERYRYVIENMAEGIIVTDTDASAIFANPAAERIFGVDEGNLTGHSLLEFLSQDQIVILNDRLDLIKSGKTSTYELQIARPDGAKRDALVTGSPRYDSKGRFLGSLVIVHDITERKRAEEALQHSQKMESLGVLAGGVAHDFNNLLVGIMGNVGLALCEIPATSPVRLYLADIEKASQRAADLTQQMLAYAGRSLFIIEAYDLSELVEEMGRLLAAAIPRNVTLKFNLSRDLPAIEADATQIRQVAMNLIINAAEAIGDKSGVVSVTTGVVDADRDYLHTTYLDEELPEGRYVYLDVADTGFGMDAETKNRIFDPFYSTKFTGRGLGLAAVLGIVRGHHGAIAVDSEPGKGSAFRVLFPASKMTVASQEAGAVAESRGLAQGTILVVDDEPAVRTVARRALEQSGFTVLTAANGREGLETFSKHSSQGKIDAVLLDVTMPELGGEETYRDLKRMEPDVQVVITSGYNEKEATTGFPGKALAGFLQKPFAPATLVAKMREVCEKHRKAAAGEG